MEPRPRRWAEERQSGGARRESADERLSEVMAAVARGDEEAFAVLFDALSARVFGMVRRVLRDEAQSEEVAQEVMVEVWRTATRYDPSVGGVVPWVLTLAHRRAVDRVRSEQSASQRDLRVGARAVDTEHDVVADRVEVLLEHEQVRRCLGTLTDLQKESITLAYWSGYSYREVAELVSSPLGTVKARMRDGLIRLRDCLGVMA